MQAEEVNETCRQHLHAELGRRVRSAEVVVESQEEDRPARHRQAEELLGINSRIFAMHRPEDHADHRHHREEDSDAPQPRHLADVHPPSPPRPIHRTQPHRQTLG